VDNATVLKEDLDVSTMEGVEPTSPVPNKFVTCSLNVLFADVNKFELCLFADPPQRLLVDLSHALRLAHL
jgi:hypothetical protein